MLFYVPNSFLLFRNFSHQKPLVQIKANSDKYKSKKAFLHRLNNICRENKSLDKLKINMKSFNSFFPCDSKWNRNFIEAIIYTK